MYVCIPAAAGGTSKANASGALRPCSTNSSMTLSKHWESLCSASITPPAARHASRGAFCSEFAIESEEAEILGLGEEEAEQESSDEVLRLASSRGSRARIQFKLPRSVLISPLWQLRRLGCARLQLGNVFVENRLCT